MIKRPLVVLISSLLATTAWAGAPGANTHGSSNISISADVDNVDTCLISRYATQSASVDGALASAVANAFGEIVVSYSGDVTLDLTRHGSNGAVHQVDLTANLANGTLFAQTVRTGVSTDTNVTASSSAEVDTVISLINEAVDIYLDLGIDRSIDIAGTSYDVEVSAGTAISTTLNADSSSEGTADANALASTAAVAGTTTSATSEGSTGSGSSFYVQGANIEQFQSEISLTSDTFLNVDTRALADTYANALTQVIVHALAEASVEAYAAGRLDFDYDLPIIGSGHMDVAQDIYSAYPIAMALADAQAEITATAEAMAGATASTIASSAVNMNLTVQYENLPGKEDLLTAAATGNMTLDCSQVSATAAASASADASPSVDGNADTDANAPVPGITVEAHSSWEAEAQ